MAYGDYDGPDKPDKGQEGGSCNRRLCQSSPAIWYNHGSYSWYCSDCARDIGQDVVNLRDWTLRWEPELGHPQFETREMIYAREKAKPKAPPPPPSPYEDIQLGLYPKRNMKSKSSSLQRMLNRAKK